MKKLLLIISICLLTFIGVFIFMKRDAIFQEGNPTPYAFAASKMMIKENKIVKVKEKTVTYMVKQGEMDPFIKEMTKRGWKLEDRDIMGNKFIFNKGRVTLGCGYKYYTRYYTLIYVPSPPSM